MKRYVLSLMMGLCMTVASFAQSHSDRISLGVGALYERGLDATLAWEHETRYHNAWEYFFNAYLNGTNVLPADMSAQSLSGTTTAHGASVSPTSPVSQEVATTTAICVSEPVQAAIPTSSLEVFMSATSTTSPSAMVGDCLCKPNAT